MRGASTLMPAARVRHAMVGKALVGTSGWGRPDWVGPFYPVHLRERPDEWLAYYASRFRTVEITASFDAFPDTSLVEAWARAGAAVLQRAPFEFSLKLPRAISHEALPAGDVQAAREVTGRFDREVLDPIAGEGLLGTVLLQLPPRLDPTPRAIEGIQAVLGALAERRIAIELRNPAWFENGCVRPEVEPVFSSRDVCLVEADLPGACDARAPLGARHAYMRLHGRRADLWRSPVPHDGARYDHLYAREDLLPLVERARDHVRAARETRVYLNNAPRAQSVANAVDVLELLGAATPPQRPRLTQQRKLL